LDDLVGEMMATGAVDAVCHGMVPNFHCLGCDFQVMRIDGYVWTGDVEYLFFRNSYPDFEKLRKRLQKYPGAAAYCCQCSWKSTALTAPLEEVADGLRWRIVGL